MKDKKAAIQMSIGTIITLVLMVSFLILGLILTRNLMCGGIQLSDQITDRMENEIQDLFGSKQLGVKCMNDIKLGSGGARSFGCVVLTNKGGDYAFEVEEIESLSGATQEQVDSWVLYKSEGDSFSTSPGQTNTVVPIRFSIPQNVPETELMIKIDVTDSEGNPVPVDQSFISIEPVGSFTTAMC